MDPKDTPAADFKYPWEAEFEAAQADQARRLEQAVEKSLKSSAERRIETVSEIGLDNWLYREVVRALCLAFALASLFAVPKLALIVQSDAIQQRDPAAWFARTAFGNIDALGRLRLGSFSFEIWDSPVFGALDALQLLSLLGAVLWLWLRRAPSAVCHPELAPLSAASYAVHVAGLPPRLPDAQANLKYDFELLRHFEEVFRELDAGEQNSLVCEVALVRDFGRALLLAQSRRHVEAKLEALEADALGETGSGRRASRFRSHVEALSRKIAASREDESERAVLGAYVIFGTEQERGRLLRAYRFARLPLRLGRVCQSSFMRFEGRPLVLSPAPEPGDIVWTHVGYPAWRRCAFKMFTIFLVAGVLVACSAFLFAIWQYLLWHRVAAAAQCGTGLAWPAPAAEAEVAPCQSPPPLGSPLGSSWHPGCDCFCAQPSAWRTPAEECRQNAVNETTAAVLVSLAFVEAAHQLLARVVPQLVRRWRLTCASHTERSGVVLLAVAHALVPFTASAALLALKVLASRDRPSGLRALVVVGVDRGWYLHAAPVAALWTLVRWLEPAATALFVRCRSGTRANVALSQRYASLIPVVVVAAALQPVLPWQAPLAAAGLLLRQCTDRYTRWGLEGSSWSSLPVSTVLALFHTGLALCAAGVGLGAALAFCVLHGPGTTMAFPSPDVLRYAGHPAWPPGIVFVCMAAWPVLRAVARSTLWFLGPRSQMGCQGAASFPQPAGRGGAGSVDRAARAKAAAGTVAVTFQEAWLVMTHAGVLPTYQIHDHPSYRGGSVLNELQPDIRADVGRMGPTDYITRNMDKITNIAVVGAQAPSRRASAK